MDGYIWGSLHVESCPKVIDRITYKFRDRIQKDKTDNLTYFSQRCKI